MNKEKGQLSVFRNDIIFIQKILKEYGATTSPEKQIYQVLKIWGYYKECVSMDL